jgi:hypothetical protein
MLCFRDAAVSPFRELGQNVLVYLFISIAIQDEANMIDNRKTGQHFEQCVYNNLELFPPTSIIFTLAPFSPGHI